MAHFKRLQLECHGLAEAMLSRQRTIDLLPVCKHYHQLVDEADYSSEALLLAEVRIVYSLVDEYCAA